ncbi:MAG TPA: kelch repeat-containing protein [Actinomycetota bacterium]|nr:kelch repeat-containing protein [Actinomycetota bacterium]
MDAMPRRAFLRGIGLAAAAAACSGNGSPRRVSSPSPAPTAPAGSPTATATALPASWRRIEASGPSARRDATLTGDPARGAAYLFGGRSGSGTSLGDLWVYDVAGGAWRKVDASEGPGPRFGHNAGMVGGKLVVFAGQGGPTTFFNDLYTFDPDVGRWSKGAAGNAPAKRYGSGDAVVDDRLLISHGFTNSGRFDDTWTWSGSWSDASPGSGVRPVKRCLHRSAWWPERNVVALFGGQTDGTPFLNDFWLYDPAAKTWTKAEPGTLPGPRTLFGMVALAGRLWVWSGFSPGGQVGDMWWIDDPAKPWQMQSFPDGQAPGPRGGIAAAAVSDGEALMFGGRVGDTDLDELWSFRPGPA